ncbi:MAG: hypothetical protein KDB63_07760 [Nocardioidaceae bacterium]|nr:hypothetical protein [Nocardioidaceae bacterium]
MALRNNKSLLEQSLESAKAMVPTVEAVVEAVVDAAKDGFESAKDVVENASEKAASGAKGAADAVSTKVVEVAPVAEKLPMVEARSHKGRGRFKKLLFLGALAAVVAVAVKKLRGDSAADNWQSAYVPTPPPATKPAAPAEPPVDDEAGAGPDEAAADGAAEPHEPTSPDAPAEVVEVDEAGAHKGEPGDEDAKPE